MDWPLLVLGKVLIGNFAANWIFRSLGNAPTKVIAERVIVQYAVALLCAAVYLFSEDLVPQGDDYLLMGPIFLVGTLASAGFYFKLRANAVSLSRFAVFEMLVAVIPITLSATLLGEWVVFKNGLLLFGFVLSVVGVALYFAYDFLANTKGDTTSVPLAFYWYGVAFILTAGTTAFLMNVWAKADVPTPLFLSAWYLGTFVGSGAFYLYSHTRREDVLAEASTHWGLKKWVLVVAGGGAIFTNMWFLFGSFQQVELLVLAPIYITFDILGPILMGMLCFKEWKALRRWGYLFFGMDVVGAGIIGLARVLS